MPKVSVIIPVYNVEKYLRECLDSVINQTLKDIEIICVNDGSTDSSLSILEEYAKKDKRIKIINKANSGYGHTMNVGIDNATGEYIGIVEPDDYIKLDMYETLYNKATEYDLDFIKADFYRFTGSGKDKVLFYNHLDNTNTYYNKILNPQNDLNTFNFIMNSWSGIYKTDFINKNHIRHNETPGASYQDNGFYFQTFMYATKIYILNIPFYMNRRDNPNSSIKNKNKVYAMKNEYDYIRNILEKNENLKSKFLGIYWVKKYNNYMFTFNRIDKKFKKEFIKVFSKEFKEGYNNNEIDENLFRKKDLKKIHLLVSNIFVFYLYIMLKLLFRFILSFTNSSDAKHKIITLFGLKIKIKRRSKNA